MSLFFQRLTPNLIAQRSILCNLYKASKSQPHSLALSESLYRLCRHSSGFNRSDKDSKDVESVKSDTKSMDKSDELPPSQSRKFNLFEKSEEELIFDYREELLAQDIATDYPSDDIHFPYRENPSKYDDINLERGKNEVIDIEELVSLLRQENMQDIAVLALPPELRYTDYMLIASARSFKHLEAVTAFIIKVWKLKKLRSDPFLKVEGEESPDWKTLDMGSIVVHLFMPDTREKYDLESLWALGAEYDDLTQKPATDPSVDLLEKHIEYLKSLKPVHPPIRKADMVPVSIRPGTMTKQQMKVFQAKLAKERQEKMQSSQT